jgi:hypothetical protein
VKTLNGGGCRTPGVGFPVHGEFCPSDRDGFDSEQYFRAVWRAHVAELRDPTVSGEVRPLAS